MQNIYKIIQKYLSLAMDKRNDLVINCMRNSNVKEKLADLGCGSGDIASEFITRLGIKDVYGVDINKKSLNIAEKKGIKTRQGDLNIKIPFNNSYFKIVTCLQTIEHLQNIDKFLEEARRILRTKGIIIITTENLASWHNIFALLLGNQPYTGPYLSRKSHVGHHPLVEYNKKYMGGKKYIHTNVMTTKALVQLLKNNEFKIISVMGAGYLPFPMWIAGYLSRIDPYHSVYSVVVAKKTNF